MKTGPSNIDQLFKDSLGNFEADVNPSVWENIEKGLQSPSGSTDTSIRSGRILGKVKVKKIISFLALSGAAILAILYFTGKKSDGPLAPEHVKTIQQTPVQANPAGDQKVTSSTEQVQQVKSEKSAPVVNQNHKGKDQQVSVSQNAISEVDHTKEKVNTSQSSATPSVVKESIENIVHPDKNSSESSEISGSSKTAESNHDSSVSNPTGDESNNDLSDYSPVADTENGYTFYVPDRFTPNGDGVNDYFTPMGSNFKDYEITIYDPLGIQIFNSKDIANSWDGRLGNGRAAPYGIYLYIISVKDPVNKNHIYKGKITLTQ